MADSEAWDVGEGPVNDDFFDDFMAYKSENEDINDYINDDQPLEFGRQSSEFPDQRSLDEYTARTILLATNPEWAILQSHCPSFSSMNDEVAPMSEAPTVQKSLNNFTEHPVTICPSNMTIKSGVASNNGSSGLAAPTGSMITTLPRQSPDYLINNTLSYPFAQGPSYLVGSPGGQPMLGLGLGIEEDLSESNLRLMLTMDKETGNGAPQHDLVDEALNGAIEATEAQINGVELPTQKLPSPQDVQSAPCDDATGEQHSAASMQHLRSQIPTESFANVPGFSQLSTSQYAPNAEYGNYSFVPSTNTSPELGRQAFLSPAPMSSTHNIPKSATSTTSNFMKSAYPLTAWQTVNESTHHPTMKLVSVALQHESSLLTNEIVQSMDYRDASWQGRSDEYKGWTPYVNFADFPNTLDMLQRMRADPQSNMPDTVTIFKGIEQVEEWREKERLNACRNQTAQNDEEIPRTMDEKAAVVKLLFKAFKTTIEGQSNPSVLKPFEDQVHSNAHVEAVCWQLLEGAIKRSEGAPLCHAYEPQKAPKAAAERHSSFAERIDDLIHALMWEKSVCVNLLKAPKVCDAIDYPSYLSKRTANNRHLNGVKADIAKLGKKKKEEMENSQNSQATGMTTLNSPSKRNKRTRRQLDNDADSIVEPPAKRHSPDRRVYATPTPRFSSPAQRRAYIQAGFDERPTQSPSSSTPATTTTSNYSTPSHNFATPSTSTTGSIRSDMGSYNFHGLTQPNFTSSTFPPSPLDQTSSLNSIGSQYLQSTGQNTVYTQSYYNMGDMTGDGEQHLYSHME